MGIKYIAVDTCTEYPNGSRLYRTPGPFASVAKVEQCPCEDGVSRNAFATAEPDTFFSIPAVVYVHSKSVSGFLTIDDDGWKFIAYSYGKKRRAVKAHEGAVMKQADIVRQFDAPATPTARITLVCNECQHTWRVSPNAVGPQCANCNSVDFEVKTS